MTLSVTITAPNTVNEYGLTLVNGSTYSLADDLARSLVAQGKASWSVSQSVTEAASPTSVPYKSGIVDLAQMGASKGARSKQIANAFVAGMARAGHIRLSDPGTYVLDASTASIVCQSNCTIEICAGVTLDVSSMSAPCFTATSKSNIRLTGDGKIVCSASSVPTFTSVSGLEVSVRIEDSSGRRLIQPLLNNGGVINITGSETIELSSPLVIYSNTNLLFGPDVTITLPTGLSSRFTLIKNANWGSTLYTVSSNQLTSAAGRVGTCKFTTATNFAVGDYVLFQYAAQDVWNRAFLITAVSTTTNANDTITFRITSSQAAAVPVLTTPATPMTGAPDSVIVGCKCDYNIHISGGIWNHRGYDQGSYSIAVDLTDVMIHMRRVYKSSIRNAIYRGAHYSAFVGNAYDFNFENINAQDCGNAAIFTGSGAGIRIRNVLGKCYDNILAVQQGDYSGYIDSGYTQSDFSGVTVENVHSDGAYCVAKAVGTYGTVKSQIRDISFRNITGWCSSQASFLYLSDDPNMLPYYGASPVAGTKFGRILVDGLRPSRAASMGGLYIGENHSTSNAEEVCIVNSSLQLIGNAGQTKGLFEVSRTSASANINKLTIANCVVTADAATNTVLAHLNGNVSIADIHDNIGDTLTGLVLQGASCNSAIDITLAHNVTTGSGFQWKNQTTSNLVRLVNPVHKSPLSELVQAAAGSATVQYTGTLLGVAADNLHLDSGWSSMSPLFNTYHRQTATSSGANTKVNYANGNYVEITLTQATTQIDNATRTPATAGGELTICLIQDGTGGRAYTMGTAYKGHTPFASGTTSQRAVIAFRWNGANWSFIGGSTFA